MISEEQLHEWTEQAALDIEGFRRLTSGRFSLGSYPSRVGLLIDEVRRLREVLARVRTLAALSIDENAMRLRYEKEERLDGWAKHRDDLLTEIEDAVREALDHADG